MQDVNYETSLTWIADSTPDYIILINLDFKVIYLNRALTSLNKDELIGVPLYTLVKEEDRSRVKSVFEEVVRKQKILTYETDFLQPNGEMQYFESLAKPLILDGQLRGISISSRDITQKKINEQKYKQLFQNFLRQKEDLINILEYRTEELSQFALTMNHDVKNFLNSILMFAKIELEKGSNQNLEKILRATISIRKLLDESLNVAKEGMIISSKTGEFSLSESIENLSTIIIPNISVKFINELPNIKADEVKVMQIFKNLFENAVNHGKATEITITFKKDVNSLIISNNGKSIPNELRDNLFRGDIDMTIQHGNGLKIVKKIVQAHGWNIKLLPEINNTSFEISF